MPLSAGLLLLLLLAGTPVPHARAQWMAGVSKTDITPDLPIRLSGYAARKTEATNIIQRLYARAIAFGDHRTNLSLIIAVDNCALPTEFVADLCARIGRRTGIPRERIAVCSSHTHSGPWLTGSIPNMFAEDIPADQIERVDRYTRRLKDQLETNAAQAAASPQPALLDWAESSADFAANRRTPGGPVDHALPMLRLRRPDGTVAAFVANYACHCTTLVGDGNAVCGDWAGFASESIENIFTNSVALSTIGCGADSNPNPRGKLELARQYGAQIASRIQEQSSKPWTPITAPLHASFTAIELPFGPLPTREEWERRARETGIVGYHARRQLQKLDRGETLPTTLPYSTQAWTFGSQLALVFLPGEVVVDYALTLKSKQNGNKLWITAYANGVPCYIPSRRILTEGGYEAETSLWYYDRPARLAPESEEIILQSVSKLLQGLPRRP